MDHIIENAPEPYLFLIPNSGYFNMAVVRYLEVSRH
jgi:hypothetical protein